MYVVWVAYNPMPVLTSRRVPQVVNLPITIAYFAVAHNPLLVFGASIWVFRVQKSSLSWRFHGSIPIERYYIKVLPCCSSWCHSIKRSFHAALMEVGRAIQICERIGFAVQPYRSWQKRSQFLYIYKPIDPYFTRPYSLGIGTPQLLWKQLFLPIFDWLSQWLSQSFIFLELVSSLWRPLLGLDRRALRKVFKKILIDHNKNFALWLTLPPSLPSPEPRSSPAPTAARWTTSGWLGGPTARRTCCPAPSWRTPRASERFWRRRLPWQVRIPHTLQSKTILVLVILCSRIFESPVICA